MINYMQINILDMINHVENNILQKLLSSFACPLNFDVENFIHTKASEFAKQKIAISYLVFAEYKNQRYLVGYYTLTNKFVCVNNSSLSNAMRKRILKFSQYDPLSERYMISMPLIAQLGKNYNPTLPIQMNGIDLLQLALERVLKIEHLIGGKTVYIECNNQPKLFNFYSAFGFFPFDQRNLNPNKPDATTLIQMLKYFK